MNLQTRAREEPEVNLTSLIDVVLLLLVFFMVSTTFVDETELKVKLPEATQEAMIDMSAENLEVVITASGAYRVGNRELINNDPLTLRRAIEAEAGDRRDLTITIRADAQATHQSVVTAMDIAGRLGFVNLNIATTHAGE